MTDYEITETMIQYGGSFIKALGTLYRTADVLNQERIKHTWPEYWKRHTELAELEAQRQAERGGR